MLAHIKQSKPRLFIDDINFIFTTLEDNIYILFWLIYYAEDMV